MLRVGQENMLWWSVEMFHGSPLLETNPTEGGHVPKARHSLCCEEHSLRQGAVPRASGMTG